MFSPLYFWWIHLTCLDACMCDNNLFDAQYSFPVDLNWLVHKKIEEIVIPMDVGTCKALSFFVLVVFHVGAEHIDCGFNDGACRFSNNITCLQNSICTVSCTARNGCRDATINCKDNQDCHIISTNRSSVRATTINCPSNANCLINGTAETNAFLDATINCGLNGSCYFLFNETAVGVSNFHFFKKWNATTSRHAKIYKYGLRQTSPNTTTSNISSSIYCPVASENNKNVTCEIFCGDFSSLVVFCGFVFLALFSFWNYLNDVGSSDHDLGEVTGKATKNLSQILILMLILIFSLFFCRKLHLK